MRKIKIYLSSETAKRLVDSIDIGSAQSRAEGAEMERVMDDLGWADEHRDEKGNLEIKRETLDWVIAELDWYCSAFCNQEEAENER